MSVNTYDAAKHHVGLKTKGAGTNLGFMLAGGYTREMQRAALGNAEFGGSTDLIGMEGSLSRLTQDDFLGGAYQFQWGKDDAMFNDCEGWIPSQRDHSLCTVPPMYLKQAINVSADTDFSDFGSYYAPVAFFTIDAYLYIVYRHGIYRWNIGTQSLSSVYLSNSYGGGTDDRYFTDAVYDSNDQHIYLLVTIPGGTSAPFLQRLKPDLTEPTNQQTYASPFTGSSSALGLVGKGLQILDTTMVVGIGRRVYSFTPPEDTADSGTVNGTWAMIGRLPGPWIDSVAYDGGTYILCGGVGYTTHLMAFTGQSLMPVVTFPFAFAGKSIVSYGGRIFVGGVGSDVNGAEWYGELYEVTGASVRLVHSWSPEVLRSGAAYPKNVRALAVHEGLLWFCHKGVKMIAYDLTSDGFFGASSLQSASDVDMVAFANARGRLWAFGVSDGSHATKDGIYRIAQPVDGSAISNYSPIITTSDFVYEPAVKKRLSEIHVLSKYKAISAIEVSVDGGSNWTSLSVTSTSSGVMYHNVASAVSVAVSEQFRMRFTMAMLKEETIFGELVAYTTTFAFLDTGKRSWTFVINVSDYIEGRDLTTVAQDISDYTTQLWSWATAKTALTFTDLDGTTADVNIQGFREHQPIIGPNISGESMPEKQFTVTLIEV